MSETITRLEYFKRMHYRTYGDLGKALGVSGNQARNYCVPPSDGCWQWMNSKANDALKALTAGELHAGNYSEEIPVPPTPGSAGATAGAGVGS